MYSGDEIIDTDQIYIEDDGEEYHGTDHSFTYDAPPSMGGVSPIGMKHGKSISGTKRVFLLIANNFISFNKSLYRDLQVANEDMKVTMILTSAIAAR